MANRRLLTSDGEDTARDRVDLTQTVSTSADCGRPRKRHHGNVIMPQPSPKKLKLNSQLPFRNTDIAENNKNVLKMKPRQIFEIYPSLENAFGSSNASWRAFIDRLRGDYGIRIRVTYSDFF